MRTQKRPFLVDILLGAAAGGAATWLMDRATTFLYERESRTVRAREDKARGEKTAYEIAAEKLAKFAGRRPGEETLGAIGSSIHWSLGVGAGAMYGTARHLMPALGIGSGLLYGTLFWLVMDEAALTALGLTPAPKNFPWQTHARGLAGHLVLGSAIEIAFDLSDLITAGPTIAEPPPPRSPHS